MAVLFRPAAERGRFTDPGVAGVAAFSHGSAYDPDWRGFRALRVLNRVELAPGIRLPAQRRANMEVLTLVLDGTYRCTSQAGDSGPVGVGQWHRLGAGAGVDVVEENLATGTLRLLQLWVQPARSNARPAQQVVTPSAGQARIAGPVGEGGPTTGAGFAWGAAATVRRESIVPGGSFAVPDTRDRGCWLEVIGGELGYAGPGRAGAVLLRGGDGMGVAGEPSLALVSSFGADLLVLELPA